MGTKREIHCRWCDVRGVEGDIFPGLCPVGRGGVHEPEFVPNDLLGDPVQPAKVIDPERSAHARALRLGHIPAPTPAPTPPPKPVPLAADGTCQCCGQKVRKLNPHRMDASKVAMLEILGKAGDWMKVQEGASSMKGDKLVRAPYRARAHVSRLVWFGLAEHGDTRSGLYRITTAGYAFLRGEHLVPDVIYCKDGKVVERSTTMVGIGSVKDVILDKDYWDNYWQVQKAPT